MKTQYYTASSLDGFIATEDHSLEWLFQLGDINDTSYPEFIKEREAAGTVWRSQAQLFLWPVLKLWEFPKPLIAQVHGYAIGGGTTWALLPEITVASEDAYFQMPLVPGFGLPGSETMFEPWVFMNYKRAAEYLYTAQKVTAAEALEFGLVNRVVPAEEFDDAVADWARKLASKSPLVMKLGKDAMWRQMDMPLADALDYLRSQLTIELSTEDAIEGVTAFFEKREPEWKGR